MNKEKLLQGTCGEEIEIIVEESLQSGIKKYRVGFVKKGLYTQERYSTIDEAQEVLETLTNDLIDTNGILHYTRADRENANAWLSGRELIGSLEDLERVLDYAVSQWNVILNSGDTERYSCYKKFFADKNSVTYMRILYEKFATQYSGFHRESVSLGAFGEPNDYLENFTELNFFYMVLRKLGLVGEEVSVYELAIPYCFAVSILDSVSEDEFNKIMKSGVATDLYNKYVASQRRLDELKELW